MTFEDGSCAELFNNCNPETFAFHDQANAMSAVLALFDQVFVDGPMGNFDSSPNKVFGCGSIYACYSLIPFGLETFYDGVFVMHLAAANHYVEFDQFGPLDRVTGGGTLDRSTAGDDEFNPSNYAIFELAPPPPAFQSRVRSP